MKPQLLNRSIRIITLLAISLILVTCKKETPFPIFNDQGNIGPDGGIVKTNDGASVEIPAGALINSQMISITSTTKNDTVVNGGCRVYDLKPDGLAFTDSVTLKFTFDDTNLDLTQQKDNYGIGIMVFQDNKWIKLKTVINITEKIASTKIKHFSKYIIYYPDAWSIYYFNNRYKSVKKLAVPYYNQSDTKWCAFNALSMVTKYAGYSFKAPYFASLLDKPADVGMSVNDFDFIDSKLNELGIKTKIAFPAWGNIYNLCGYVLHQINAGLPVMIATENLWHAIVVTGHDQTGFFVNDPGTSFLKAVFNYESFTDLSMIHIPYEKFEDALINLLGLFIPDWINFKGAEHTLVITSSTYNFNNGLTINIHRDIGKFDILNENKSLIGRLEFDGKYKPLGYSLRIAQNGNVSVNGTDYLSIIPCISNSSSQKKSAAIHYKIDNREISGSPIQMIDIPTDIWSSKPQKIEFQLSNLNKGNHVLKIELRSIIYQDSVYDYWEFPFTIENEYFPTTETVTDIDNNTYKTVQIGNQTWMAENLKTTKLNDGTNISLVTDQTLWYGLTTPGYCYYNNNSSNKDVYGALYNWFATSSGKLCPAGWHVPSNDEWKTLENTLGGAAVAGKKLKEAGTSHWTSPNNGTDEFGFAALPGGYRHGTLGFSVINEAGVWSTSSLITTGGKTVPWYVVIYDHADYTEHGSTSVTWGTKDGYSIRCVKN